MTNERSQHAPTRRPYAAPQIILVRVDPVTELLQNTQCTFEPSSGPGDPGCDNPCG